MPDLSSTSIRIIRKIGFFAVELYVDQQQNGPL
jgi:hypothetical protein